MSGREPIGGVQAFADFMGVTLEGAAEILAPRPVGPRTFTIIREVDESGVSGTGRVLDGVLFHTGQVVVCWRTDIEGSKHGHSSLAVYASWEAFDFIHIKSHPTNRTRVEWLS